MYRKATDGVNRPSVAQPNSIVDTDLRTDCAQSPRTDSSCTDEPPPSKS